MIVIKNAHYLASNKGLRYVQEAHRLTRKALRTGTSADVDRVLLFMRDRHRD